MESRRDVVAGAANSTRLRENRARRND